MTEQEREYFNLSSPEMKFKVLLRLYEQLLERLKELEKK